MHESTILITRIRKAKQSNVEKHWHTTQAKYTGLASYLSALQRTNTRAPRNVFLCDSAHQCCRCQSIARKKHTHPAHALHKIKGNGEVQNDQKCKRVSVENDFASS